MPASTRRAAITLGTAGLIALGGVGLAVSNDSGAPAPSAAAAQPTTLYACVNLRTGRLEVGSAGGNIIRAYTPACPTPAVDVIVHWTVSSATPPPPTTATTQPPSTTTPPTVPGGTACPTADPASTYAGRTLSVNETLQAAYDAGFRTVPQLQAVVGIGRAESSLVSQTRNWHIEYGCRPATDAIGVQGPASAWNGNHTRQLHSDRGIFQISSWWWPMYTDAVTDDPAGAARAMWAISDHGANFSLWDTWKNGAAQPLQPSVATVEAFLAGQ